ncbi:hypothetical protein DL765_011340 [Monosporascus sp. GIB2]|nr:hypothetical protein DL765_011340 [Monosporascus sp. GIB2]
MVDLHNKYGPVLRIAPDELSYASAQAWQDIYGQTFSDRKADLEKDRSFYMVAPNGVDSIITARFDVHYRFRRLLQVPLSDRALMQQEYIIQGYVDLLIQRLHENAASKEHTHKPLDIVRWVGYTCFDVLGDLAFGESFGCLERGKSHWWIDEIQEGVKAAFKLKTIERFIPGFFPVFMKVMMFFGTAMAKNPEENFNFCALKARERLARPSDRPDFKGGCVICGQFVPGGYSVGVNQSAVMRSEAVWVDPSRYAPERWLQDPAFAADDKKAYQPFSFGPRNCIGKSLAQAEMRLILTRILWNFDIQIAQESKNWAIGQKTNAFWEKPPLYVTLTPVARSN